MYICPNLAKEEEENGMEERIKLLRQVCRSRWFPSMSREELKLYLLLLVSTDKIGREGEISWGVLKRSLGASLTSGRIERLTEVLRRYGLVQLRLIRSSQRGRRLRKGSNFEVRFTLLRPWEARGPASRGSKQQRESRDG